MKTYKEPEMEIVMFPVLDVLDNSDTGTEKDFFED